MGTIPVVSFLSDFGAREYYVSAVKGVILEQCREAQIIDISQPASYSSLRWQPLLRRTRQWRPLAGLPTSRVASGILDRGQT